MPARINLSSLPAFRSTLQRRTFQLTPPPKTQAEHKQQAIRGAIIGGGIGLLIGGWLLTQTDNVEAEEKPRALSKDKWTEFTVSSVKPYNHNTTHYTFDFPDPSAVAGLSVTSCLMVRAPEDGLIVDAKGKDVARPYTPVSKESEVGKLELLIKKYDTGKLKPWLAELKPGDKASFKGPFPKYPYKPSVLENGICIAGGSGITPMYQLISHSLAIPDDKTKWTLIYSNVTEEDILLKEEFAQLAVSHPTRFNLILALDKPPKKWTGPIGYISREVVEQSLPSHTEPAAGEKVHFFICGPPGQVAAVAGKKDGGKQGEVGGVLKELGYSAQQVYKF